MRISFSFVLSLYMLMPVVSFSQENIDTVIIQKITTEEMQRSQVMNIAFNLTDVSGPRLSKSPGYTRAAN